MSDGTFLLRDVSNGAKIRNRYNQVPHLTQDNNGKVTNSQKTPQTIIPTNVTFLHNLQITRFALTKIIASNTCFVL